MTKVCELLYPTDHLTRNSSHNEAQPKAEKMKVRLYALLLADREGTNRLNAAGWLHPSGCMASHDGLA